MSGLKTTGYLGIDVGSISTNVVVIDPAATVLFSAYRRVEGHPIRSVQQAILELKAAVGDSVEVAGVCTTGSARTLIGAVVGADVVKNEISTHARAAVHLHPEVRTIFEIGGQDSKVTLVRDGVVVDFAMNLICAAGTGSFLDSQAKRLNLSIEELSERALLSRDPTAIAGRCTVFAESDMIHKQQSGHPQHDIVMGLCHAMVRNFLGNVCAGKEIKPPIVLQGGVSANLGIRRAFNEVLNTEVIIPRHHMVMGAYGAALMAARAQPAATRFRGYGLSDHEIVTRGFRCGDCANRCEIIEIVDGGLTLGRSGGRCRKWEAQGAAVTS
jgi:predicted CoA-substrate-specific enzyme activase